MTRILGVIPARYASTRFPGKPLADLEGEPLIVRVAEAARQCRSLSHIVVATDDARIADASADQGIDAVMTSPEHPTGTDRVAEVARTFDADIYVNIQGDEPFVTAAMIDAAIEEVQVCSDDGQAIVSCLMAEITDPADLTDTTVVKVVSSAVVGAADESALYFSRSPVPRRWPVLETGLCVRVQPCGTRALRFDASVAC